MLSSFPASSPLLSAQFHAQISPCRAVPIAQSSCVVSSLVVPMPGPIVIVERINDSGQASGKRHPEDD